MSDSVLSQIRIVETERLLPFEWLAADTSSDERSDEESRYVRHPFPVLDLQNGSYLLLENVERYASLGTSSLNHLPVQLCNRKGIRVQSERLGLIDFDLDDLGRLVARHPDQILMEPPRQPSNGYVQGVVEFPGSAPLTLYFRDSGRTGCAASIDLFFRHILQHGEFRPVVELGEASETVFRGASYSAFIKLPQFSLEDLETAAKTDRLFPPNIISVQTESRVFYIDFPQSVLRSEISVREKETFLKDLLRLREQSRRTSRYEGQIYILNR